MRRGILALFALLLFSTASFAQVNFRPVAPPPSPPALLGAEDVHATPEQVVARLMSFDRDGDRKVTKDELAERLENLLEEADASGDGSLDEAEIRSVADQPAKPVIVRGFQAGRYGFTDDGSQSSRLHVEGVVADLKLPSPKKEEALGIVKWFAYELDQAATVDLLEDMASVLDAPHFEAFRLMFNRQRMFQVPVAQFDKPMMVVVMPELEKQIDLAGLSPAERTSARLALERFRSRLRTTEGDRTVLRDRLKDDLTEEEGGDLVAALARRPIAKAGPVIVGGAVQIVGPVSVR